MKIKQLLFPVFVFLSFAIVGFGQDGQISGGYAKANVADKEVIKAARFAVKSESKMQKATISLISIKNARMQVVAGLNYEICLEISYKRKSDRKASTKFVKTVVYRNLKNVYSLTSWKMSNKPACGGN